MTVREYRVGCLGANKDDSGVTVHPPTKNPAIDPLVLPMDSIRPEVCDASGSTNPVSKVQSSSQSEVLKAVARVIGIDKLSLSARLRSFDQDPRSWWSIRADGDLRVPLPSSGGAPVQVRVFRDGDVPWATVEFNPSRFVDPAGFGLAPLASVPSCIDEAISVAGEVVEFADELRLARVKRVDVTRDFTNVEHVSMLIKGFVGSHRPNARMTTLTLGTNGVAEGLATGSRSGGKVLLYDKFIESGGKVPEGTLRYEAQCRAWAQSQAGINTAMDLTEERLALLAWNRWLWSGFGSFVTGVPEVLELINRSDFSERVKRDLKGYIVLEQRGELGHLAPGTKSSYTQKLAKLGIPPSMPIDVEGSGNVRCLDLLEGTDGVFSLTEERTR